MIRRFWERGKTKEKKHQWPFFWGGEGCLSLIGTEPTLVYMYGGAIYWLASRVTHCLVYVFTWELRTFKVYGGSIVIINNFYAITYTTFFRGAFSGGGAFSVREAFKGAYFPRAFFQGAYSRGFFWDRGFMSGGFFGGLMLGGSFPEGFLLGGLFPGGFLSGGLFPGGFWWGAYGRGAYCGGLFSGYPILHLWHRFLFNIHRIFLKIPLK